MKKFLLLPLALVACSGGDDCDLPGSICTWAGSGERGFDQDGHHRAATAFYWPMDLEFGADGRAYLLDWQNHRVRRVEADGTVDTVVGTDLPGDGPPDMSDTKEPGAPGTTVELNHPTDLALMPDGKLLIAAWHNHKIRSFDPVTGLVQVICGAGPGDVGDRIPATRALLNQPKSVAVKPDGTIYVADSRNARIKMIDGRGVMDVVAGNGQRDFKGDGGLPLQASFFMQESNENPEPGGSIALDARGRLYLADTYNNRIRRLDFDAGSVETIAGNGTAGFGGDGGPAKGAQLARPRDLEIGPDGRLYVADTDNHRVRVIDLGTGVIDTFAGNGTDGFGGDGGPARDAALARPFGIAFDTTGNLYIADTFNDRIRKVTHR